MAGDREKLARRLLRVREIAQRQQVAVAQAAREQLEAAEDDLAHRREQAVRVEVELRDRTFAGVGARELLGYAALAEAARRGEATAEAARDQAAAKERQAADNLLTAVRERQAADKLLDRAREAAAVTARAREQRTLDEISNRRPAGRPA